MTAAGDARERDARAVAERAAMRWPEIAPRAAPASELLASLGPGDRLSTSVDPAGGVRVHSGVEATRAAASIGARAFTVGAHDLVLARPELASDDRLLRHELAHLAQARDDATPIVARDDDDGRRYYTPDAQQNADEVIAAASAQNPIAGRGDYNQVWTLLDALPTPMLLETLLEVAGRGRLQEMWGNIAGRPGRVRAGIAAALLVSEAPAWGELEAPMVFHSLAQDLEWLGDDDRAAFTAAFGGEEMMSIVESTVDFGVVAPPSLIAAASIIGPGPWNQPGNMPWTYYVGTAVHDAIASYYESRHPEAEWRIYSNRIANRTILAELGVDPGATRMRAWKLAAKPDIVNMAPIPGHLYEIKPWRSAVAAYSEAVMYTTILRYAGLNIGLGPSNDPGVQGVIPAPGGFVVFWSPTAGVILYQWGPGTFDPKRFAVKAFPWQLVVLFAGVAAIGAILAAPETGGASILAPLGAML